MKTILISTSQFGTPIPDYFKYLGEKFAQNNYSVVFIFDGNVKKTLSHEKEREIFFIPK